MNIEQGLRRAEALLIGTHAEDRFRAAEAKLRRNLLSEELFGDSETTRRERAQIVGELNALLRETRGMSFGELC